jgi:uncharacterized protein YuzE
MSDDKSVQMTIGGITFDRVRYDADADMLYLHVGDPASAVDFDESSEGHHLRFDADGHLVGLTLVGVRHDLESGSKVTVTLPQPIEIVPGELRRVFPAA